MLILKFRQRKIKDELGTISSELGPESKEVIKLNKRIIHVKRIQEPTWKSSWRPKLSLSYSNHKKEKKKSISHKASNKYSCGQ